MEDKFVKEAGAEQESDEQKEHAFMLQGHWRIVAVLLAIYDVIIVNMSYFMALWLRFDCQFSQIRADFMQSWMRFVPIYTVFCLVVFSFSKLYRSLWRFARACGDLRVIRN